MYKKKKINVKKKFRKNFNTRVIQAKKTYSIEEIAKLLNVHKNTVLRWLEDGLLRIDSQQPYLVWGKDLIDFLKARKAQKRRPCAYNQLFCCKCQKPMKPKDNKIWLKISICRTNMIGICEECGSKINRTISPQKIDFFKQVFNTETVEQENLIECDDSSAIVTKKRGA